METTLSRRLFLGGLVTIGAVSRSKFASATPVLIGDGVHDDGPALNAWLRGEPVRILNDRMAASGKSYAISRATLAVGEPIHIPAGANFRMHGCMVSGLPRLAGDRLVEWDRDAGYSHISHCVFDTRKSDAHRPGWAISPAPNWTSLIYHSPT